MRWTPDVPDDGYETFVVGGSPAQRAVLASFGGRMALFLSVAVLAVVAVTPGPGSSRAIGVVIGCAGIVTGTLMIRYRHRMPLWLLDLEVPLSVPVFVAAGIIGGSLEPLVPYVFAVYSSLIYAMRTGPILVLHTAALGAGYAAILAWGPPTGPGMTHWVAVMAVLVSAAYFTLWLMRKVQALARSEHEARAEAESAGAELSEVGRAKSQFLSRVSHELRTPLNAVVGFSELLQSGVPGPLNGQQAGYVDDVVASSRHLHSLLDDVLDLASVESGSPVIDVEPVAVGDLIAEAITMLRSQAAAKDIEVDVVLPPDAGSVSGDRRKLRQVLLNLLSNAVKFTDPRGRVEVAVEAEPDEVVISVSDTGTGIDRHDRERIFEAFQRGDQPEEGTGLGLSVARRLVELHGGDMWVHSVPGTGSSFSFRLPRQPSTRPEGGEPGPGVDVEDEAVLAFVEPGSDANRSMLGQIGTAFTLLATGVGFFAVLITPGGPLVRVVAAVALTGVAAVALLFRHRTRLPGLGTLDLVAAAAVTLISAAVVWGEEFADVASLAYLWVVLVAAALHTRARTITRVVMVAVAYALALSFSPGSDLDAGRWIAVMAMVVANVTVVDWTVNRIREVAAAERRSRRHAELVHSELAAISRHQSEFLASMSHELRTPLNAVIGFSDVLASGLAGPLSSQQADYVDEVLAAGRHLLDLINDLLDLAKLDAGRLDLDRSTISVAHLLSGAVEIVTSTAAGREVAIEQEVSAGVGSIVGDRNRLEQVLCNVLMNAVESTPRGGHITARAARRHDRTEISVADTGSGIDPDELSQIFAPFHRGHGGTLGSGPRGPGLGLAVVKGIVELHGGAVHVASQPGQGAVFTLALPASDAEGAPTADDGLTHA